MPSRRLSFLVRHAAALVHRRRRHPSSRRSESASPLRLPVLAAESLEPRALLAVTATLVSGDLVIEYNSAGDVLADISSDGTKYTVTGTGLASKQFSVANVTGVITVKDLAAQAGQTFKVLSGTSLANPLQVDSSVETTSLLGGIVAATAGDVLIGSKTISLANNIATAAKNGNVTLSGDTTLASNATIAAGSGAITLSSTVNGGFDLTANSTGNVTFNGAVGGGTRLGAISIESAKNVTASAITAASLSQAAGSGTTTLNGAVNTNAAAGVSLTGTNLAVNAGITTTSGGTVTFNQKSGTIAVAAAGDILADGAVSLTATGGITTAGDVTTTNDDVTFASKTTLSGPVAVNTGAGAGNITYSSTLDGTTAGAQDLALTAGTGNVTFNGLVGDTAALGAITVNSATNVTANGIRAASLKQVAGSGTTTLNGGAFTSAPALTEALRTSDTAGISLTGTNLAVNGAMTTANNGKVKLDQSGTIVIAAAGDISADNKVSIKAIGGITTAGDVTTTDDDVDFESKTTLSGNIAVNTGAGAGNITFQGTLDGTKTLGLTAGTGAVSFKAAVGSITALAGITLTSAVSTTAESTVKLAKAADSGQDGLAVAAGVNNVKMTSAGSSVTGFTRNGISFLGGSTDSRLSGFTVSGNGGNGMSFAAGSYTGTTLTANTISDNGDRTAHVGDGILVQGSGLMIGWDASPAGNTAANTINSNALNGIHVDGGAAINNTILSNSIYLNGYVSSSLVVGEGIALKNGGNNEQSAPRILDIVRDANENKVRVQLIVDASGSYLVQLFRNTPADERSIFPTDANGFEGRSLVGESPVSVVTPVTTGKPVIGGTPVIIGNTLQTIEIDAALLDAGDWLTATATRLAGTLPTNTSSFSAGVQVLRGPVLAVGGDGQSVMWDREFAYNATSSTTLQISGLTAAQAAFFSRGTQLTITPAGAATTKMATVVANTFDRRTARATITLSGAIPVGSGTLVLGLPSSLPAARLVNASNTQIELPVGNTEILAALAGVPGLSAAQRNAFVTRFQGGLRVAAGDFDGDGHTDLVTAPGGVPANLQPSLRNVFGSAGRVITIYNGAPASPTPAWSSASIDVGAVFGSTYLGGFLVTVGNVTTENSGSGNAVLELIVASTGKVAVFDVTVPARGAKPVIGPSPTRSENVAGTITGLASGTFSGPVTGAADIVVAATTATPKTPVNALNTTSVSLFQPAGGVSSFKINSLVSNGDPKRSASRQVNVFLNGASLAVGDIDNQIDQKPELILGAGAVGLGNFRVLAGSVVQSASQTAVNSALSTGGLYSQPARGVNSVTKYWQPTGGPDYFVGVPNENVPTPIGSGFNAPLSIAVVESNGKNFRAELFAAIGAANQTSNQIRSFQWNTSTWSGQDWFAVPEDGNRLRKGSGLRLG